MSRIKIDDLKEFCAGALVHEGMKEDHAATVAEVLSQTDAFGTHSHGTKNLYNYIKKFRAGGIDIKAEPQIVRDGISFALIDAQNALGMIPSVMAMELACDYAEETGIAIVTVKNSCHFGAAGYYANIAAKRGMIGLSMSNVDPNMTAPGAKGKLLGNNPFSYAAPALSSESMFLDIAMSNVASLKVVQARKSGKEIPSSWIVDKDGIPTTDPNHYPEEGAMQPMAAHKGYGLAVMVDILTALLAGSATSMSGDIVSWCFELEKPNNVSHTFIAINSTLISGEVISTRTEQMAETLHAAPKAKGAGRIYTPGEIEWGKYKNAEESGIDLPTEVEESLNNLARELNRTLPVQK